MAIINFIIISSPDIKDMFWNASDWLNVCIGRLNGWWGSCYGSGWVSECVKCVFLFPKFTRHSWELSISLSSVINSWQMFMITNFVISPTFNFSPHLCSSHIHSRSLYINCQWHCHNFLILLNVIDVIEINVLLILNLVILIITIIIRSSSNNNNSSTSIKSMNSGWIDVDLSFIVVIRFFISICNIQFLLLLLFVLWHKAVIIFVC